VVILQDLIMTVIRAQEPEAQRKDVGLLYDLAAEPLYAFADPVRIIQVVTNLLANAINYTPPGGMIHISARLAPLDAGAESALLVVKDTGIGISHDNLPQIFQPFFRVDSSVTGTGLGLSITRQIVELHGGDVTVESELGRGSTFRVRLPLTDPERIVAATELSDVLQPS
jgi:signal transduction histidine kinase